MKGLFLGRGKGKTTALVYASAITAYPIVVMTEAQKTCVLDTARRCGVDIPTPVVFSENARGLHYDYVLVDNAEEVLRQCIADKMGAKVFGFTMTYDRKE